MFALNSRLPSNDPPSILTSLYYHETPPLSRQQGQLHLQATVLLNKPTALPALRPQWPGTSWTRAPLHKAASLPPTPHFNDRPGKIESKGNNFKCAAVLPGSVPTSEHQMWFWSREDVEPTESSEWGEVRPSVLQRCGDAVTPVEEQRQ